jgi:glucosamine-6-phosphate deaminase
MNLLQFDSDASWVDGVCAFWRDRLRTRPHARICLPTGLTPVPVYTQMVRSVEAGDVSFAQARLFALDEFGGLPPEDPGNTRNTLLRQLVSSVDLAEGAFRYLDAEGADVDEQCREYDRAIGEGFDLAILGIGVNGHLGMNEPGSSPDSPTRRVDLHETTIQASSRYFSHGRLPRWGVTVGLRAILASAEVWLLATGAAKAQIVGRIVGGSVSPEVPASLLRRHANCSLFVDPGAGAALRGAP